MRRSDYLIDLKKWQAYSHPDLANTKPEELFEKDFVEQYHRLHNDLWGRIIRVHGTLRILEELNQFPFEYLYAPTGREFWRLIVENFYDIACLLLCGLVSDTGEDVHTLSSFRSLIIKGPWLCEEKRDLLKKILRERKFDRKAKSVAKRVKGIRHKHIAHRLIDRPNSDPDEAVPEVSLKELWQLFDAAHSLFGAFSFGTTYATLSGDLIPSTVGGQPKRTCLDEVLDAVLRDSFFVKRPETLAKWWPELRKNLNVKELKVMNDFRKRIGLPEA